MNKFISFLFNLSKGQVLALGLAGFVLYGVGRVALFSLGILHAAPASAPVEAVAAPTAPRIPDPIMAVRPYLRRNLHNWDSYDSQGYSPPEAVAPHAGVPAWRVRHTYRAKNGFGGIVLTDQLFYYTAAGVYQVTDIR